MNTTPSASSRLKRLSAVLFMGYLCSDSPKLAPLSRPTSVVVDPRVASGRGFVCVERLCELRDTKRHGWERMREDLPKEPSISAFGT